jgi:nitrogen fixation NifU-like protein
MSNIYQENIIDHYTNPKNFKVIKDATYKGKFSNLSCGDEVEVYLSTDSKGNITDIGFQGSGCALSIATTSILTAVDRTEYSKGFVKETDVISL